MPYVIRPFTKERQLCELQHIENRGLYKEELSIERHRFPNFQSTFVIQTDGSINEREMEITVPPIVVLFHDRLMAYRQRQLSLAKIGQLHPTHSWEATANNGSGNALKGNENTRGEANDDELEWEEVFGEEGDEGSHERKKAAEMGHRRMACCNALEFPYCVPRMRRLRATCMDPLSVKSMIGKDPRTAHSK